MTAAAQLIEVLAGNHAAVANQHDALDAEALLQVMHHIGDGHGIAPIAGEHVVRDRPAVDQNQADQHLRVARLAIAAVAMRAELALVPCLRNKSR